MANKSKVNWTIQGKPVKPTTLKVELIESYEAEKFNTATAIIVELDKLIQNLDRRSTNRGRGFLSVRRNKPLSGLFVETKETKKGIKIFVPVGNKGSAGYIFNLLDQGRPPINTTKLMKFSSYSGTLTKEVGDTSVLNRSRVISPSPTVDHGDWISTHQVSAITPRNFFESIRKKLKFINFRPIGAQGKFNLKKPKFKWESGTVEIKITRNGK